nr:transposase [Paracoccus aerius]
MIQNAGGRMVKDKAVCIALGVTRDGLREPAACGLPRVGGVTRQSSRLFCLTTGAGFWLSVMNELKNPGLQDILIALVDGLKGFPEAITAAFPDAMVGTSSRHVHLNQWHSHG